MSWLPKDFDNDEEEQLLRDSPDRLSRQGSGDDIELESIADSILAKGRRGTTKHSELRDYLSRSQLDLRRSREVYPEQGYPEENIYSGLYKRAYNPTSRGEHSSNSTPGFEEEEHHQ